MTLSNRHSLSVTMYDLYDQVNMGMSAMPDLTPVQNLGKDPVSWGRYGTDRRTLVVVSYVGATRVMASNRQMGSRQNAQTTEFRKEKHNG